MKFVKLHRNGSKVLVNLSLVTEVYPVAGGVKSNLYLNLALDGNQVMISVDESLDEIYEIANEEVMYENAYSDTNN